MGKRVLHILGILFLLLGCGKAEDSESLESASRYGVAETSGYPAVVRVVFPGGAGLCTGAFVSPKAVLTASHCTQSSGTYTILSNFGTFTTNQKVNYGPGSVDDPNDISLLILASDVANPNANQVLPIGDRPRTRDRVRLVGYGCNDLDSGSGAGVKRTGTNQIYQMNDYIELNSPRVSNSNLLNGARGLVGPENRAASCFGDSGSPLLYQVGNYYEVVGVGHAGGWNDSTVISQYADIGRTDNRSFLVNSDSSYSAGIFDFCNRSPRPGYCDYKGADMSLWGLFLKVLSFFGLRLPF